MQAYMKFSNILIITLGATFFFALCKPNAKTKVEFVKLAKDTTTNARVISLANLVRQHNSLDGQNIQTEGIVYYEFENVAICLGKGHNSKCFWLDLSTDLVTNDSLLQSASGKEFIIKGTVDNSSKGHLNYYLATIRNVYYLKQK
ncbi:MAG: hypothetical protein JNK27_04615 [Chitinophagaceae bacterium]|nr:hypothetical protein [Chitinophagaceae bacterium]